MSLSHQAFVEQNGDVYPFMGSCIILNGKKTDKMKILVLLFLFFSWDIENIFSATPYSYVIVSAQFKVCIVD